jgi:cytolysin-activating lysine-acyltransferase
MSNLRIVAPQFEPHNLSEAEVLGSAVWLWLHSATHQGAPLTALNALLLPAIKTGQYLLAFEHDKPIAYVAWAQLDEAREANYLQHASMLSTTDNWRSGERLWVTDYIAPFGHAMRIRTLLTHHILPNSVWRSLYHKGNDKGLRVMTFHGAAVHPLEAKHWFLQHPVCQATSHSAINI